jgi:hypothetical protein
MNAFYLGMLDMVVVYKAISIIAVLLKKTIITS